MKTPLVPKANRPSVESHVNDLSSYSTEELLTCARDSLSNYCMTVCKAKCCKRGQLLLTPTEAVKVAKRLEHPQLSLRADGCYNLQLAGKGCPSLNGTACGVYAMRPKMCREYPVFSRGMGENSRVIFASSCDGNAAGLLQEYKAELARRKIRYDDF